MTELSNPGGRLDFLLISDFNLSNLAVLISKDERTLQPGEQVVIELGVPDAPVEAVLRSGSVWYRGKVFARRHLCELRDNYTCRLDLKHTS